MAEPVIKIENLKVVYDKGLPSETEALKGITLDIYPEEYVIFFGPSGCGKSTLLYTIAGLEVPDSGRVIVYGRDLGSLSASEFVAYHRSQMGMVFQAFYLIPSLSVLDNVVLPQMFIRERPADRRERGEKVMESLPVVELDLPSAEPCVPVIDIHLPSFVPTPPHIQELERLGEQIAELAAHFDAAVSGGTERQEHPLASVTVTV